MSSRSQRRQALERELRALGDEAMLIEEFDGFVAGLLVCPEMISPNEWLPLIFDREGQTERSPLEDIEHANRPDHGKLQRCRADLDESTRALSPAVPR
jgi:uncharacterized protein